MTRGLIGPANSFSVRTNPSSICFTTLKKIASRQGDFDLLLVNFGAKIMQNIPTSKFFPTFFPKICYFFLGAHLRPCWQGILYCEMTGVLTSGGHIPNGGIVTDFTTGASGHSSVYTPSGASTPKIWEPIHRLSASTPKIWEAIHRPCESTPKIWESIHRPCESTPKIWESIHRPCASTPKIWESIHRPCESAPKIWEAIHRPCESTPEIWEAIHRPCASTPKIWESIHRPCASAPKIWEAIHRPCESTPEIWESIHRPCESAPKIWESIHRPCASTPKIWESIHRPCESAPKIWESIHRPCESAPKIWESIHRPCASTPKIWEATHRPCEMTPKIYGIDNKSLFVQCRGCKLEAIRHKTKEEIRFTPPTSLFAFSCLSLRRNCAGACPIRMHLSPLPITIIKPFKLYDKKCLR